MGACAGDYDNDGLTDLYITSDGPNVLYRNTGNGAFTDVTAAAHVGSPLWSTSCAFADLDRAAVAGVWRLTPRCLRGHGLFPLQRTRRAYASTLADRSQRPNRFIPSAVETRAS